MTAVYTPADLADELKVTEANVLRWRRERSWPSLKVGRHIRFTQEHVDQILAELEVKPAVDEAPVAEVVITGQTARSARARRSA